MLGDFNPGLERAAAGGVPTWRAPYPSGDRGVALSIEKVCTKIMEGRYDPAVSGWAVQVVKAAGLDGRTGATYSQIMAALLAEVRKVTIYKSDALGSEVIQGAAATLCLRPDLCIGGGDCDDLSVALGAAIASMGIPVRVIKQSWRRAGQEHVLVAGQDEHGGWVRLDPSTTLPAGQSVPADEETFFDPTELLGLAAEIVTLGAPAHHAGGGGHAPHPPRPQPAPRPQPTPRPHHLPRPQRGGPHRLHDGAWWSWWGGAWIPVDGEPCSSWGPPIYGAEFAALIGHAHELLAGGQVAIDDIGGTLYRFSYEAAPSDSRSAGRDILVIRACADAVALGTALAGPPVGLGVWLPGDVDQIETYMDGQIPSINAALAACHAGTVPPQMTASWSAFVAGYVDLKGRWDLAKAAGNPSSIGAVLAVLFPFIYAAPALSAEAVLLLYTPSMYAQMRSYEAQIPTWWNDVAAACPGTVVPASGKTAPDPGAQLPTPTIGDQVATAAKYVGGAALTIAGAYGIYQLVRLAADYADAHKAGVRRRRRRR